MHCCSPQLHGCAPEYHPELPHLMSCSTVSHMPSAFLLTMPYTLTMGL